MKAEHSADASAIRVVLPYHLKLLARVDSEVQLAIDGAVTQRTVIAALERHYPVLQGVIIDHATGERRPMIRFFACQQDLSHEASDAPLPQAVRDGREPLLIVGAIAGG